MKKQMLLKSTVLSLMITIGLSSNAYTNSKPNFLATAGLDFAQMIPEILYTLNLDTTDAESLKNIAISSAAINFIKTVNETGHLAYNLTTMVPHEKKVSW